MYMVAEVYERFTSRPWPASSGENPQRTTERRAAMRQVLERYVRGSALVLNKDIKELGTRDVDHKMRGYWEFRSQGRMTETRLFGFFARPGAFIATDFQPRNVFTTQADWVAQRESCEKIWANVTGAADFIDAPWPVRLRTELAFYLEREDA